MGHPPRTNKEYKDKALWKARKPAAEAGKPRPLSNWRIANAKPVNKRKVRQLERRAAFARDDALRELVKAGVKPADLARMEEDASAAAK